MCQFLIDCNQPLAGTHRSGSEELAGPASEDAFRVRNRFQDFKAKARQFTVLFGDMDPAFVGQPNRRAASRDNRRNQISPLLGHRTKAKR
jgi:hypothetical protein